MNTCPNCYPDDEILTLKTQALLPARLLSAQQAGNGRPSTRSALYFLIGIFLLASWSGSAFAQGALTNGWTHTGTIAPVGDSDSWTFSATIGDTIVLRVGEISQT